MNPQIFNPFKVLNHWDRLQQIAKGEPAVPPVTCEIDPSNYCNHDCVFCFVYGYKYANKVSLKYDVVEKLINDLAEFGVKSVTFTGGGEPFTNSRLIDMIRLAHKVGLSVGVVTNGGLLRDKHYPVLVECCDFIRFSVDASKEQTYQLLHRPHNETLTGNVAKIEKIVTQRHLAPRTSSRPYKPTIGMAFLVHPYNHKEVSAFAQMAKSTGVDYVQIRPVLIEGMVLSDNIWKEALEQMEAAMELQTPEFSVLPISYRFDEVRRGKRFTKCLGHNLVGVVGADGNVYLCCQMRGQANMVFGNINEIGFKEIWLHKQRQTVIKRINVNKCPSCRYTPYNEILEYLEVVENLDDKLQCHPNFL